jgi:FKBP-type peptidyl-prolyl cis-trans isomerase FkpA
MKKILFLFLLPLAIFSSCSKNSDVVPYDAAKQAAIDDATIKTYLTAHPEITNVKDTLGVYYQVITPGTGAYPTDATKITVNYTGTLLDGTQFDANTNFSDKLVNFILGWRIVLPHVRNGGKVLMLVPSIYGYANYATGKIPPNSVLLFSVTLLAPNNQ